VEDALEPGYAGVHVPPPNLELYRHLLHGSRRIGDSSGTRGERVLRLGFGVWARSLRCFLITLPGRRNK
jgi:hypothetical protein